MEAKTITKKEAHAEGIKFLAEALDAADQADACFRDAHTRGYVEGRHWGTILGSSDIVKSLDSALKSAKETQCDDCGKLIAECGCEWANSGVR